MGTIHPAKAGLALGALFALWHFGWSLLVAAGWAQPVIDFVFWMHFIKPVYAIQAFSLVTALVLIGITAITGFVIGSVFGLLWNWIHKE